MTDSRDKERTPRILVIDNDDDLASAIATRLGVNGYTCVTASNGAQGLSIFGAGEFDLVVTDLNMPGGDGITVVESIRESRPDLPILVVTGFTDAYRDRLRGLPHVSCLRKPFDSEVLVDLVETELALVGVEVGVGVDVGVDDDDDDA